MFLHLITVKYLWPQLDGYFSDYAVATYFMRQNYSGAENYGNQQEWRVHA